MKMKLTKRQQEMLDGKHGEAKKFCMDKLVDFGEAVEATEMVDLVPRPLRLSHLVEEPQGSENIGETQRLRPGTQPAL